MTQRLREEGTGLVTNCHQLKFIVKDINRLLSYPFSSLPEYLDKEEKICNQELIYSQFSSGKSFKKFIVDQADYQRNLQIIKHQLLES